MSELSIPFIYPTRLDCRSVLVRRVLDITIDIKSDRKHIAVRRVVAESLARITLHAWFVRPSALIGAGKPTLWFVGRRARLPNTVTTVRAASGTMVVVAARPDIVRVTKPIRAKCTRAEALDMTKGKFIVLRSVPCGVHSRHSMDPWGMKVADPMLSVVVD